jgi:hypothetical protein
MARKKARKTAKKGVPLHQAPAYVPDDILSALEPGEAVEADFKMGEGLEIYATGRRLFGRRGGRLIDIQYTEVSEATRRTSDWRTWRGIARMVLGTVFVAAGVLTGFETLQATIISLALFVIGAAFVLLGIYRRDDWVELKIDRREPPPSFWYIVVFLPFWLLLQSRKRYKVPGNRQAVDAFYQFLIARLPQH